MTARAELDEERERVGLNPIDAEVDDRSAAIRTLTDLGLDVDRPNSTMLRDYRAIRALDDEEIFARCQRVLGNTGTLSLLWSQNHER